MRKNIILLILLLMLCGCGEEEVITKNTISPLTEKFIYTKGVCLKDNTVVEYSFCNRGDVVSIVDEDEDFYYINNYGLLLSIRREYIRTEKEEPFVEHVVYTRNGALLYLDVNLNEKGRTFSLNEEVTMIDEFAGVILVKVDDEIGYMNPTQVSETIIQVYVPPKREYKEPEPSYSSNDGSGGDSSSSSSEPAPAPAPTPPPEENQQTSGDGEDISIALTPSYENHFLAYSSEIKGTILMDNTISYLTVLNRNDEVCVFEENENELIILINGYKGRINKKYVRQDSDEPYEIFEGYTISGAIAYSDYEMNNRVSTYGINERVKVIDEIDGIYVIEIDENTIGYMNSSNVSKEEIYIAPRIVIPKVEEPTYTPSSEEPSSPSPEPAPAPAPEPVPTPAEEWTPEVL